MSETREAYKVDAPGKAREGTDGAKGNAAAAARPARDERVQAAWLAEAQHGTVLLVREPARPEG